MAKKQGKGVIVLSSLEEDFLTALLGQKLYGLEMLGIVNKARYKQGLKELGVGSLYPTLQRMEKANLIQGEWGEEVADSTRRRYYTITSDGQIAITRTQAYRKLLAERKEEQSIPDGQHTFYLSRLISTAFR